jgi:ribosomal protein L19
MGGVKGEPKVPLIGPLRLTVCANVQEFQINGVGRQIGHIAFRRIGVRNTTPIWAPQCIYMRNGGVHECIVVHRITGGRAVRTAARTKRSFQQKGLVLRLRHKGFGESAGFADIPNRIRW